MKYKGYSDPRGGGHFSGRITLGIVAAGALAKKILPWGGGGYFRLIPFCVFRQGIRQIFRHEDAYLFYMHPWEIDPEQPRVKQASAFFKFRHYSNLHRTEAKLSGLFQSFADCCFMSCRQYLKESAKCA